jgi:hypothetical protein
MATSGPSIRSLLPHLSFFRQAAANPSTSSQPNYVKFGKAPWTILHLIPLQPAFASPTRSAPAQQPGPPKPIRARRHGHGVPGQETWTALPPGAWAPRTPTPCLLLSSARAACALQPPQPRASPCCAPRAEAVCRQGLQDHRRPSSIRRPGSRPGEAKAAMELATTSCSCGTSSPRRMLTGTSPLASWTRAIRRPPLCEIPPLPSSSHPGEHSYLFPMTSSLYSPTRLSSWMAEAPAIGATRAATAPPPVALVRPGLRKKIRWRFAKRTLRFPLIPRSKSCV